MQHMPQLCPFVLALLAAGTAHANSSSWITIEDYPRLRLVLADSVTDGEKQAAAEFALHWEKATGHAVPVRTRPGRGVNVWVGRDGVPDALLEGADLDSLGTDGMFLRTIADGPGGGPALVLSGGRERGTLYAAYEFLERALGIRWLTPEITHIPPAPASIEHIAHRYAPQILRRTMSYSDFGWRHHVSGGRYTPEMHARADDRFRLSGEPAFGGRWVHSTFTILPPRDYFLEHPEYYSEINGERRGPVVYDEQGNPTFVDHLTANEMGVQYPDLRTQLCFGNPYVAEEITLVLRKRMTENPGGIVWSVSQEDWDYPCECAECTAINEREESLMGALLTCVNRVADNLRDEFPQNYIETLAYSWSRKPPKTISPRDNVIISLCNIECNMLHPMDDGHDKFNREFNEDLAGWGKVTKNLFFWDYPANCLSTMIPYPNFHVLQKNMQLWAGANALGAYLCGGETPEIDLNALRAYLLARLMWDPWCDYEAHMAEFMDLYYGKAAPLVREYLDDLTQSALAKDALMHVHDFGDWLDHDIVTRADATLRRAVEAADTPETRLRARQLWVSNQFPAMYAQPKITVDGDFIELRRPDSIGIDAISRNLAEWGVPEFRGAPFPEALHGWAILKKLPRYQQSAIHVLENRHTELWVAPGLGGAIIRWRDKATGEELFDDITRQPAPYRYLSMREDATAGSTAPSTPVTHTYQVVSVDSKSIVMRAKTDNGLALERVLSLRDREPGIDLTVTVNNPTDEAAAPRVKIHPEFHTLSERHPRVLIEQDGVWTDHNAMRRKSYQLTDGRIVDARGIRRWAFHVPEKELVVLNTFTPETVDKLLYFIGVFPHRYHINVELFMDETPLAPGDSRAIGASWVITREVPA